MLSGYSKWWQIKQIVPSLNRGLSSNFCWLRSAYYVKFTAENVMCSEKHVLVKKVYKWAKYEFAAICLSQEKTMESKDRLLGKEKVPGAAVSKERNAKSLHGHKRIHMY